MTNKYCLNQSKINNSKIYQIKNGNENGCTLISYFFFPFFLVGLIVEIFSTEKARRARKSLYVTLITVYIIHA